MLPKLAALVEKETVYVDESKGPGTARKKEIWLKVMDPENALAEYCS
jgi:hypothetical protein